MDFVTTQWVKFDRVQYGLSGSWPFVGLPKPATGAGIHCITFIGAGVVGTVGAGAIGETPESLLCYYTISSDGEEMFRMGVGVDAYHSFPFPIALPRSEVIIELVLPTPAGVGPLGGYLTVGGFTR